MNIPNEIQLLRRPKLLLRAARIAAAGYRRDRDLSRILKGSEPRDSKRLLPKLAEIEAHMEEARSEGDSTYSISRHVEVLAVILAELRRLPRPA